MHYKLILAVGAVAMTFATALPQTAHGHFPWLVVNDQDKPVLFFGEDLGDRAYHLPESLSAFSLKHRDQNRQLTSLKMSPVDGDDLVGLQAIDAVSSSGCLFGTQTYGLFHGTKLVYFVQHSLGRDPQGWTEPPAEQGLRAIIRPCQDGVCVQVLRQQERLAELDVQLASSDGQEIAVAKTDAEGMVTFGGNQLGRGLHAIRVGQTDRSETGLFAGENYHGVSRFLTATFHWDAKQDSPDATSSLESSAAVHVVASKYPDLPTELTSFGGAIADGALFVYGGHIGKAHSYSTAEQSDRLYGLDLKKPQAWKTLSSGPRLQGLAMVPHNNSVIRFGGFTAMNAEGDEHDLHSQDTVARYEPTTNSWTELTPLPEPRSSHAATVSGNHVYVIGGWAMSGEQETHWHSTAWTADLSEQPLVWKSIAAPPFKRRALSVAAHDGKIYVVGGMDQESGPTTRVDVYDPQQNAWSKGPSLEGEPMTGFGCWAHSLAGGLYTSTVSGDVQRLSDDGERWQIIGTYEPGRFFHCMLPISEKEFVLVGGANMSVGRFTNLDLVQLPTREHGEPSE